ncbi:related to RIB7-HTP reductase [Sporisorium reilianum f. sp. reilianum]|uniref:2,5-diamino-6-ribosylamino-4(3H)-pyrimidinone 5'-phosphate reductase n=1 Tax=Sporisorium reilianum f. sp. reilianum TaxID=72559 RepID=A0A2N8UNE6_9BASI|nr:related to RIB7-HTP reductase [Sporisorium reilianum f. sp. reilianum]
MPPAADAEEQAASFLRESLAFAHSNEKPHVTLTFAQSHDAKIAGAAKAQLALSGAESMIMTHTLRTLHDAIMVGIGTVLNDNPQLNARLLSCPPPVSQLPRPVVLDSKLRIPLDCKLIRNHAAGTGRQPLVLASSVASSAKRVQLEQAGVQVIQLADTSPQGLLDWTTLLQQLRRTGIHRLMVEGGAAVIDSLMQQPQLIDALIVTIAPVTVGADGFGFSSKLPDATEPDAPTTAWAHSSRAEFGKDQVVVWHKR